MAQLIAMLNSYPHTMFPVARFKWGAFRVDMDLQPCKTMTNILAPVKHAIWMLSAWNSTLDHNDVPSA